jgi:CHASE3 domain sensor protein
VGGKSGKADAAASQKKQINTQQRTYLFTTNQPYLCNQRPEKPQQQAREGNRRETRKLQFFSLGVS